MAFGYCRGLHLSVCVCSNHIVFGLFPQSLLFYATECCGGVGEGTSVCRFKSVPTLWLRGLISACATRLSPVARVFMLLSSSLSILSSEIYLILKPYLIVKISSDIVTEHCCQVCVLSMMFCCSDCRLYADMISDCAIRKLLRVARGLT